MVLLAIYLGGFTLTAVVLFCILIRALFNGDEYYNSRDYVGAFGKAVMAAGLSLVAGICWAPLLWLVLRSLLSEKKKHV